MTTTLEEHAYVIGAWLGDGHVIRETRTSPPQGFSFSLGFSKEQVLRKIESWAEERGRTARVYEHATSWVVNVHDRALAEQVEELFGRGSAGKRLPEEVFSWTVEAKEALLQGLIDTDGSLGKATRIGSINRGLLLDVRELLLTLGRTASLVPQPKRTSGFASDKPTYQLILGNAGARTRGFFHGGYFFTPVTRISEASSTEVFNLSVAVDESYVAEGLVTHNCSICTDLEEFNQALRTFNPTQHKHPGIAVLRFHERMIKERGRGIRGIARTRREYCACMATPNKMGPDGRKRFVYNDFPRFFDISMVGRGADKTAYTMIALGEGDRLMKKLAQVPSNYFGALGGSTVAEAIQGQYGAKGTDLQRAIRNTGGSTVAEAFLNLDQTPREIEVKSAAVLWADNLLDLNPYWTEKLAYDPKRIQQLVEEHDKVSSIKAAIQKKKGEIIKETPAAVEQVARSERELPDDVYEDLAKHPLPTALGSLGAAGIVLRPREFCRLCICRMGMGDEYAPSDLPWMPPPPPSERMSLRVLPELLRRLADHMMLRSGYEEPLRMRIMLIGGPAKLASGDSQKLLPSLGEARLSKLGAYYRSYRDSLMNLLPHAPDLLSEHFATDKLAAVQSFEASDLFTPLSYAYFRSAFTDELLR